MLELYHPKNKCDFTFTHIIWEKSSIIRYLLFMTITFHFSFIKPQVQKLKKNYEIEEEYNNKLQIKPYHSLLLSFSKKRYSCIFDLEKIFFCCLNLHVQVWTPSISTLRRGSLWGLRPYGKIVCIYEILIPSNVHPLEHPTGHLLELRCTLIDLTLCDLDIVHVNTQ